MTLSTLQLGPKDLAIVLDILRMRIPNHAVYAFGSRTNGRAWQLSDLDLAVDGTPLTLAERAALNEDFDRSDLPITVDVVDLSDATPAFRARIERDFVLIQSGVQKEHEVTA